MTERTDQAKAATEILDGLASLTRIQWREEIAVPAFLEGLMDATKAQVHATLALVEQQRIANLLMLAGWRHDASAEDIGYDLDSMRTGIAGEVWEGLGL